MRILLKRLVSGVLIFAGLLLISPAVLAAPAPAIDEGIGFLVSKQDASGAITQGYSHPSQWAAIALSVHGIDAAAVKNPSVSLKEYLLTDHPAPGAAASEWESRILAIQALEGSVTNFGGVNYLRGLESFYNNNQLGETYLLNDDMFGLLALIAAGPNANLQIKQDTLNFIITHQAPNGGFSYSPDVSCQYCEPSADMTAAALQSLQVAKENGLTHIGLENAIINAKNYLLANQNPDGGFGYFGTSDADSTAWVLMALNLTGMKDSVPATTTSNWLLANQQPDGGFASYSGSDSTTTAHALIALSGQGWLLTLRPPVQPPKEVPLSPAPPVAPQPAAAVVVHSVAVQATNEPPAPLESPGSQPPPAPSLPAAIAANLPTAEKTEIKSTTNALNPVARWLMLFSGLSLAGMAFYLRRSGNRLS